MNTITLTGPEKVLHKYTVAFLMTHEKLTAEEASVKALDKVLAKRKLASTTKYRH